MKKLKRNGDSKNAVNHVEGNMNKDTFINKSPVINTFPDQNFIILK